MTEEVYEETIEIVVGEKLNFAVQPIPISSAFQPTITAMSQTMFLIILQANWSDSEILNSFNNISFDIAEIDDVIDIVVSIEDCLDFDVAYNINITAPDIQFEEIAEGYGMNFTITFIDCDTTVRVIRSVTLDTKPSNEFINALLGIKKKKYSQDEYDVKINKLYNEMSIEEIKANAFIHQNVFKRR